MRWIVLFFMPVFVFSAKITFQDNVMMDEPITIKVKELKPHQAITLKASHRDHHGREWVSSAKFQANEKGKINLSKQAPIAGSYSGIDPMGLFWTLKCMNYSTGFLSLKGKEFKIELTAYDGLKKLTSKTLHRLTKADNVERILVREQGLVGTLYLPPSKNPQSITIVLSGSEGGISESRAALLASHGIATFALGYFRVEGLPQNLENIPLEYFEKAFRFIENYPRLNGKIALYGFSRGGELSLLLGSIFPQKIHAIVATLPSSVVYPALSYEPKPAWIYRGKEVLPFAPTPDEEPPETGMLSTASFLEMGRQFKDKWEAATIKVENITCPILLISAGDDQMWPSTLYCELIQERLKAHHSSINCTHLNYPEAGHSIMAPYIPHSTEYYHPVIGRWFHLGGSNEADEKASRDSWLKIREFLRGL